MMRAHFRPVGFEIPLGWIRTNRQVLAAFLPSIALLCLGCTAETSEQANTSVSSELSAPPIAPPYLTDVDEENSSVAMRFGESDEEGSPDSEQPASDEDVPESIIATELVAETDAITDPVIGGPEDYNTWGMPELALVVTGQQHGYIEPCGCTGLDRQKGGVARRFTFMQQLRDKGWTLLPVDAGNLVRRFGRQAEVKLQQSVRALKTMGYEAVGFGPDDVRLGVGELLAVAAGPGDASLRKSEKFCSTLLGV